MTIDFKKLIDFYLGTIFLFFLRPIVIFAGKVLKRNHDPIPKGDIVILKLQGGGSLVIGASSILGLKAKYPSLKLVMLTTPAVAPFARSLHVFDEVVLIDDRSIFSLLFSSLKALSKVFRTDTFIDLEVHSRLSTIFSVFTCARNRLGFYREDVKNRRYFNTHHVFFNLHHGAYIFYEKLFSYIGADPLPIREVQNKVLPFYKKENFKETYQIAIGHGCSDLSPERQLKATQWLIHFKRYLPERNNIEVIFLGGPKEFELGREIHNLLQDSFPKIVFRNTCGTLKLSESLVVLANADEFWGIDSSLLHYARLFGKKTMAYFGPTMPQSLLRPIEDLDETIFYRPIYCSPCVHNTETPPCEGKNQCIEQFFQITKN